MELSFLVFLPCVGANMTVANRPFIIDLESTNGTHVNGEQIPESRYYELKPNDGK